MVKIPPANAGDSGSIPGSGRCPGEGNGNLFHYACLGNPMEGEPGGLQSMGVPKSLTTSKSRGTELNSVQEGL